MSCPESEIIFALTVKTDLFCAFNCASSIAAKCWDDIIHNFVLKLYPISATLENLRHLIGRIGAEVNLLEAIFKRSKDFVWFGCSEQIALAGEVELHRGAVPFKVLAEAFLHVEDCEECVLQIPWQCVAFVKQNCNVIAHHHWHENLLEELAIVLDCGAV